MFQKFTDHASMVLALANHDAQQSRHKYIVTEHILIGLLKKQSCTGCKVLKNLGVDINTMLLEAERIIESGPENIDSAEPPNTPRARQVIEHAAEEARSLQHNYIGTEHILLGLLRDGKGTTAKVIAEAGLKNEDVRREIMNVLEMKIYEDKDMRDYSC